MSELGQNATTVATTEAAPLKQVKKSELTAMVNEGKKRNEIAAHYGLKEAQVAKLLKAAGLKIRKFHLPTFELVDDIVEATAEEVTAQAEAVTEEPAQVPGKGWSRTTQG